MKIGIVSEFYPPNIVGGAEKSAAELAKALASLGEEVHVFTQSGTSQDIEESRHNLHIHRLKSLNFIFKRSGKKDLRWYLFNETIYHFKCVPSLIRQCKNYKIDILHSQNLYSVFSTLFTAKILGIPCITTLRDYWPYCYKRDMLIPPSRICHCTYKDFRDSSKEFGINAMLPLFYVLMKCFVKTRFWLLKRYDLIIAKSNFERSLLIKHDVKDNKVVVIPNIANIPKTIPKFVENNSNTILFMGRLDYQKGIHLLIEAMPYIIQKIKTAKLLVVGKGELMSTLIQRAEELKIENNIIFIGHKGQDELLNLIKEATIVTVPHFMPESYGRSTIETMSLKKPYIGVRYGAQAEMNEKYETLLLTELDEKEIANNIIRLLKDKKLQRRLSENGFRFVKENLSADKIGKKHIEIYKTLLK